MSKKGHVPLRTCTGCRKKRKKENGTTVFSSGDGSTWNFGLEHLSTKNHRRRVNRIMEIHCQPNQGNLLSRRGRVVSLCLLFLVAGGLYLNSIGNQFTNWDDGMIYSNYRIRSLDGGNLVRIFTFVKGSTYQPSES
jgi:hypothetical protein